MKVFLDIYRKNCCHIIKLKKNYSRFWFDFDIENIISKVFAQKDEGWNWTNVNWTVEGKIMVWWGVIVLTFWWFILVKGEVE